MFPDVVPKFLLAVVGTLLRFMEPLAESRFKWFILNGFVMKISPDVVEVVSFLVEIHESITLPELFVAKISLATISKPFIKPEVDESVITPVHISVLIRLAEIAPEIEFSNISSFAPIKCPSTAPDVDDAAIILALKSSSVIVPLLVCNVTESAMYRVGVPVMVMSPPSVLIEMS